MVGLLMFAGLAVVLFVVLAPEGSVSKFTTWVKTQVTKVKTLFSKKQ